MTWTILHRRNLGPGKPFDLRNHLQLVDIYNETAREIVVKKSSQLGLSEYLVSCALHACDERKATGLYVFPTDTHVSDFSSARLGPGIEASPYLESIVVEGGASGSRRGTDRITLKRIRDNFLYFRGGRVTPDGKAPQLKSIDADFVIFDEVDETDPRAVAIGRKRLGHSRIAECRLVSTPSYAGTGIDLEWSRSDRREWLVRCEGCGHWQPLTIDQVVTEWDDLDRPVVWHGQQDGQAVVTCEKCVKPLDRLAPGCWAAASPESDIAGYHPTRLASSTADILAIVQALRSTDETVRKEVHNQDLGETYTPRGGQMTDEVLDACRRQYGHGPVEAPLFIGVDVGNSLHVVVRAGPDPESGERAQRWAGETESFEELGRLIRKFNPARVVIDALPETRKCRELQADFRPGLIWLAYYSQATEGTKQSETATWNDKEGVVTIDRTRSLDETYSRFYDGLNTLPANIRSVEDYYDHLKAPVRVLEKRRTGQPVARYVEGNNPDHYAHAENYCTAAGNGPRRRKLVIG